MSISRPTVQDIEDSETRSLLRGLLDRSSSANHSRSTLARLLGTVRRIDLAVLDRLFRKSMLFKHIELLDEFPMKAPFQDNMGISLVPAGSVALDYLVHRIAENEETLCDAFGLMGTLNQAIHAGIDELIAITLTQLITRHGHSLTIARKAAFVIGYAAKDALSYKTSVDLVSAYGINGKNYGMMATIDSIGAEFNYLDLKYRFRDYATLERSAGLSRKISHLCFCPFASTQKELIELASASYEISLIDAAILLLCHHDQGIINIAVPAAVRTAWEHLATMPAGAFDYFSKSNSYLDLWAFRAAPAFVEYRAFRHIRYALQPLYDLPDEARSNPAPRQFTTSFFEGVERIEDLVPPEQHHTVAIPEKFDRETAGVLSRSCAIVWVCERDPDFSNITTEGMALLMGQTFEVDRLVSTGLLRRAVTSASNPFVKLILQTLLRAHSSATRDNFNFKDLFQRYVRENHDGDILEFMERVRSLDDKIIHYFVDLLDETMLSQMAFLMESSEAIYETRARLLEWYSDIADDGVTRSKARQLRLDRKIAAVRGAINETRLNIDSVRFRQWIEQNKLTDFSDFVRQSTSALPPISELTDRSKSGTQFLAAHREPTKLALLALVECYEEFCRNPDYGIASFLGRRIRHGTLRGTLLNGLPDLEKVELPLPSMAQYESWTKDFSSSIDALAGRLYFRSKNEHKDGLFSAEIDAEQKWQLCLVGLTRIFEQAQQDHGILVVPLLIEQFCWLLFEIELAKVQVAIGEARTKWGTLKLRYSINDESSVAFEKSTNIAVGDQFNTVISWFRKPPNISPVAVFAHVIQVALQEAQDEYPAFNPGVECIGQSELQLSGATYYVVYDALTIAVRNAAKHGPYPGTLTIDAHVRDAGTGKVLDIAITSALKSDEDASAVLKRIEEAGEAGAADADIIEGLSGIRKLKKMELERSILNFTAEAISGCTNQLRMMISIPFKGLVE